MLGCASAFSILPKQEKGKCDMEMGFYGTKVRERTTVVLSCVDTDFDLKVTFRLVVFRPFTSEVILAKVKSSDEDGIRCE